MMVIIMRLSYDTIGRLDLRTHVFTATSCFGSIRGIGTRCCCGEIYGNPFGGDDWLREYCIFFFFLILFITSYYIVCFYRCTGVYYIQGGPKKWDCQTVLRKNVLLVRRQNKKTRLATDWTEKLFILKNDFVVVFRLVLKAQRLYFQMFLRFFLIRVSYIRFFFFEWSNPIPFNVFDPWFRTALFDFQKGKE